MGGGSSIKPQVENYAKIGSAQMSIASDQAKRAADSFAAFNRYIQPAASKYSALSGGDRNAAMAVTQPEREQWTSMFPKLQQQLLNSMPPGPARDRALADLNVQMYTTLAGSQAKAVSGAPDALASIAGLYNSNAYQDVGSRLAALQGATGTNAAMTDDILGVQKNLLDFWSGIGSMAGSLVGNRRG